MSARAVVFGQSQFSWAANSVQWQVPKGPVSWARSLREAHSTLVERDSRQFVFNHFYSGAKPSWGSVGSKRERIGGHTFVYIPPRRRW
jgi:hypothetical protein